jgi:hemolysin activation/secretion protein
MLQLYEQNGSLSGSLNYSRGVGGTVKIPTGIVGQGEPQVVQYSSATPLVPDTLFNLLNWNFVYAQNLPESFRASISLTGQWANSTLPTNQQWVLGGYGNLTAWFPGVVVGDQGMLASASVSRSWEWGPLSLSPSLFLEAGYSQRSFVPQGGQATQFLSDIGIGLTASLKSGTSLTMGSAAPLARSGGEEFGVDKSSNRAYFYFNLTQSF